MFVLDVCNQTRDKSDIESFLLTFFLLFGS